MQVTIELAEVACGASLQIVQEGIPAIIPEEMCYLGWQESLQQLAALVEAKTEWGRQSLGDIKGWYKKDAYLE